MINTEKSKEGLLEEVIALRRKIAQLEERYAGERAVYSEKTLQALLNVNPETALLVNREGVVLIANEKAAHRLGTTREKLLGSCLYDHFSAAEKETVQNRVQRAFETGVILHIVDKHENRYYDIYYYPMSGEKEQAEKLAIIAIDVTEGRNTEKALAEERQKFKILADNIPLGISLLDKNGKYSYVNPKFTEMFGYTLDDIPDGTAWFSKAYPDLEYRRKVIKTWLEDFEFFRPGEKKPWIFNVSCKDGLVKTIHFIPVQLENGEILVTYEDFTQLVKAREALEESERKFRLLFEESADPTFLLEEYVIADCNEAALKIMGCEEKGALLGKHPAYISPEMQPDGQTSEAKSISTMNRTLREGSSHFEWVHRNFKGEDFWVDVSITIVTIEGRPVMYTVWRDITEKKLSQEKIEHLSSFPGLSPNPIIEIDRDGRITFCNRAAMEKLEQSAATGKAKLFFPPDMENILRELKKEENVIAQREISIGESVFVVFIHFVAKFNTIRIYATDITQRKKAEEALRKSEERYRQMFDNIPLPALVYDYDSLKILDVNKAAVEHYGYSCLEFLSMTLNDIRPGDDIPAHPGYLSVAEMETRKGPWRHLKKDGSVIDVEVSGHTLQFPEKKYRIVIVNDITERKRVEDALRFTQFAVDRAAVGIIWMGSDGRFIYVNDETCRKLGYSVDQLLTMSVHDIDLNLPKKDWLNHWMDVKDHGTTTFESLHRTNDGSVYPVEITSNYMEYNGIEYICSVVKDISERKKTDEALHAREKELEGKSRSLEEANTALKVLLKHREEDKRDLEEKVLSNVKELAMPYIEKLKRSRLDQGQQAYLDILEANLNDIVSPFLYKMTMKYSNFTPAEIQVANLIKAGKTSKEIAELLKVAPGTVDTHRNNIRFKLGLNNKKINLRTYLLSLG